MAKEDDLPSPAGMPVSTAAEGVGAEGPSTDTSGSAEVQPGRHHEVSVTNTRTAHTWVAVSFGLFFLVVVLVFILQNLRSVRVHFFWATWTIPLAVDLLLATVLGGLIVFTVGSLRIVQLRRAARRTARHTATGH